MKTKIYIWLPLYIMHQTILLTIGIITAKNQELGFACVFIMLCEAVRMLMKSHSYFRTKLLYLKENRYKKWIPKNKKSKK